MFVGITSHQRSGSHFLRQACLLNFDFFEEGDQFHHCNPEAVPEANFPRVFIHRDWTDVAGSLWAMKERFGIGSRTFDEFVETTWAAQWKSFPDTVHQFANGEERAIPTSEYFKSNELTPAFAHTYFINRWIEYSDKNPGKIHLVSYEGLVHDYDNCMMTIAKFIGSDKTTFEPVEGKVGIWK